MPRKSTKHANRILDRMFAAAAGGTSDEFDAAESELLREYADAESDAHDADWDEATDVMPRAVLIRYGAALQLERRRAPRISPAPIERSRL